jgi:hypothetical protein
MSDTFTVVVNVVEGIEEFSRDFRVNGNPVHHLLSIDGDDLIKQVIISDITGKIVRNVQMYSTTVRMEVGELHRGIYFVTLKTASSNQVLKIYKD